MKEISLTRGFVTIVDDEDYESLIKVKWNAHQFKCGIYADRRETIGYKKSRTVLMHRAILGCVDDKLIQVDHINHDTLDNRRCNLRLCTRSENLRNKVKYKNNNGLYKGVSFRKDATLNSKKWRARIRLNSQSINLGHYKTEIEAAKAYDVAAIKYFGEFARLNFPQNTEY